MLRWLLLGCCLFSSIQADSTIDEKTKKETLEDKCSITNHEIKIQGKPCKYTAETGMAVICDGNDRPEIGISYTAYTKNGDHNPRSRPLTFCFNGGPGSASIWLHIGAYGPKKIALTLEGKPIYPVHLIDNPESLLDLTDLVFIDPVSTGYSRAGNHDSEKKFHNVDEDIKSVAEFIRLYVTRNDRWESPKYLSGESYGTTRAAGLVNYIQEKKHMSFDGLILISSVLNFQTIAHSQGNDLPYVTFLPSMAATAWYYHRIPHDRYPHVSQVIEEAEKYAFTDYALALMQGDALSPDDREKAIEKVSFYTGMPSTYISKNNLRVHKHHYLSDFFQDDHRILGRFDLRNSGIAPQFLQGYYPYDPNIEEYIGPYTAAFNHYLNHDLKWQNENEYQVLAKSVKWDFSKATNRYLDVSEDLTMAMSRNPRLKVFIANGYYDLALPVASTTYTLNHMGLNSEQHNRVTLKHYEGGHMMYHSQPVLKELKNDITSFYL